MNYKVGDRVQILSLKKIVNESSGYNDNGELKFGEVVFVDDMKKNCNKQGIIKEVIVYEDDQSKSILYEIKFNDALYTDRYSYTSEMFVAPRKIKKAKQVLRNQENKFNEDLL